MAKSQPNGIRRSKNFMPVLPKDNVQDQGEQKDQSAKSGGRLYHANIVFDRSRVREGNKPFEAAIRFLLACD
jgi:hypothetical protein